MARKFIYYLRGFSRTIVLTDKDESIKIENVVDKISNVMAGNKVSKFETDNDILIVRPSDIIGVHITKDSSKLEEYYNQEEFPEEENIKLQNIVPEIDLGDIDTKEDLDVDNIIEGRVISYEDEAESTEDENMELEDPEESEEEDVEPD